MKCDVPAQPFVIHWWRSCRPTYTGRSPAQVLQFKDQSGGGYDIKWVLRDRDYDGQVGFTHCFREFEYFCQYRQQLISTGFEDTPTDAVWSTRFTCVNTSKHPPHLLLHRSECLLLSSWERSGESVSRLKA